MSFNQLGSRNITWRFPTEADLRVLAANMRLADLQELEAVTDLTPSAALIASVQRSDPQFLTAWHSNRELICISGCSPVSTSTAAPWLLATDLLDSHLLRLTKEASKGVQKMLTVYPHLANVVDIRQGHVIRWLHALGFRFSSTPDIKPGYGLVKFEQGVSHV